MAGRGQVTSVTTALTLVVVVVVHLCASQVVPQPCRGTPGGSQFCRHNQSGLCLGVDAGTMSCNHQLRHKQLTPDMAAAECQAKMTNRASQCGSLQPAQVYTREKPLARLRLYHYRTWMGERGAINFTFPAPDWNYLNFQYKANISQSETFCLRFKLLGVRLPLSDTLTYDCVVFKVPGNVPRDSEVILRNDRGEGRTYTFRVPGQMRINPQNTSLSEWHVFFYLHQDFLATSSHLPVTVQSVAHFGEVSYKVSIVKCLESKSPDCGSYATLHSNLITNPKEDQWTVQLPLWSNPGSYAVTVQLLSGGCPEPGCYIAMSPTFDIKASKLSIWISIGMGFFLISFLTCLLMFNRRLSSNQNILQALQHTQPSVLLIYLPESQPYMEVINMLADFLKSTCHLLPYLVDRDLGIQDPNCWTRDHISTADKVLLIIPENPDGESITPVRNQWIVALNYLAGHHFTMGQVAHKVAAVILPSSGSIPSEILHMCRFKLVDQIAALVTWLHNGTWRDEVFLWRPTIRASSKEIRAAAVRGSSPTGVSKPLIGISAVMGNGFLKFNDDQTTATKDEISSLCSEDSTSTDRNSVFDKDIPSVDKLWSDGKDCTLSLCSQSSYDSVIGGDDIFT